MSGRAQTAMNARVAAAPWRSVARGRGARAPLALVLIGVLGTLASSCAGLGKGVGPQGPAGAPPAPAGGPRTTTPPAPPPTPPQAAPRLPDHEPAVDIGLAWDLEALTLAPVGVAYADTGRGERAAPMPIGIASVQVRLDPGGAGFRWMASRGGRVMTREDTLVVHGSGPPGAGDSFRIRWNGKTWRGQFRIFVNPRNKLTLVARLPLETYLLGVVPGEIGALTDDLLEAGRAQAIAARSYTLFYRGRRAAEGFDLYGTVEDQLYGPVESERSAATRCVESTRGRLALSGGRPIRANYCSTCGGITADVWEAWPVDPLPYLVSHLDHGSGDYCAASPQYRWREEWPAREFTATLARFAPAQGVPMPSGGVGDLIDVRVDRRSRSGRVWQLTVTTSTGDIVIPAYVLRQVLRRPNGNGNSGSNAILRSNLFKVDVRRDRATRRALAVVVSGAGSGHGVGLCQTGALGMARAGSSSDRILEHYYPGIEIKRAY